MSATTYCNWPAHRDEPKCEKAALLAEVERLKVRILHLEWSAEQAIEGIERGREFDAIHALRRALDSGRTTPCVNYTARSWSPGSEQPEGARCVNCGETHGPAVGGSESRVAPGQPADGERSAPPTDLGAGNGSSEVRS